MKVLNSAYERLLTAAAARSGAKVRPAAPQAEDRSVPQMGRLSQQELERLIESIGTTPHVDLMLAGTAYNRRIERLKYWTRLAPGDQWEINGGVVILLLGVAGAMFLGLRESQVQSPIPSSRWYWLFALPVIIAVVWRVVGRRS